MSHAAALSVVDGVADSLDGLFQDSERAFAEIGAGLGDAIVDFGALTATFETLSRSLENEDMRAAADRLATISRAIDAMNEELVGEHAALAELLVINREVADRLGRLQDGARTMTILTLNAKIEAARLDREAEDLSIFSVEMARTVKIAQETVDAHSCEQADLIRQLASACVAQAEFERSHRDKIASIAQELKSAFAIVDERRRRAAEVAAGVGVRSKQISAAIGVAIIALQIGDNTRQRIEHVVDALRALRSALSSRERSRDAETRADEEAMSRTACLLEAAQIEAAANGFEDGLRHIRESLEQLVRDCASIGAEGEQICGASNAETGSFFGLLEEKLDAARQLVQQCVIASASVDQVKSSALRTLMSLQERMSALDQAVKQMTLVGINAGLKSRHFGLDGLGLGVIAEQLRSNAKQISCDAESILPPVQRALALAHGFQKQRKTLLCMEDFESELSATLGAFDEVATRLDGAFDSLLTDSRRVNQFLSNSVLALEPQQGFCGALRNAMVDLENVARDLSSTPENSAASAAFFQSLSALYTMEGERVVHRRFDTAAACPEPTPTAEEDDLADILFA